MNTKTEFLRIMAEQTEIALATFTTIPHTGNQHVKAKGLAKRSSKTVVDMAEHFIAKVPDYKKTIDYAGESLILFEVRFDTAIVTKDLATISTLRL